jgi:ESCRT-II complex subunit VPS25
MLWLRSYQYRIKTLVVHDCPLWSNDRIQRRLNQTDVMIVLDDLVSHGHGEWLQPPSENLSTRTSLRILWRKPEELATDVYQWAVKNGFVSNNTVCTMYELHSGEDVHGTSFQGIDEDLLRRALTILEEQQKCTIFQGDTSEDDGIKFF